nr:T9SS type A sorting domain-containing protein [uncultured Flavobacterium sp.]
MKKIYYFLLASLLFFEANSQTIPAGENISLDQQLSNISQTSVTSGIIYERVIQIANIYNFNTTSTFNTANFNYFQQALDEMNRASNGTKLTTLANFRNLIATTTAENQVDLSILNTQYHILNYNEDVPSQGGLTFNTSTNKFVPISGKAPFLMLNTTIIAPTKDYVSGTSVIYKIRNDLFFKNGTKNIKTLVANFGDGINRTLINSQVLTNQNITVNYTTSGEKISKFTITYTDNTTLTTYGKIFFQLGDSASRDMAASCFATDPYKQDFQLQADIPFTGYVAGDPTIKAKIEYRVFYGNTNTDKKIRKPIIIIDGFDPGDKRKIEDCDCENIPDCAARNTTNGVFDPEKHKAMVDLMEYYNGPSKKYLLPQLRLLGYDVIMVNHPKYTTTNLQNGQTVAIDGGAYYIESNAMALVKLLIQTKQLLVTNGSTNNIAVVGPSMGGQISRYALAYMEKNNIPHNTYLWVSVDSPHLGANIPMGDQALLNLVKNSSHEAKAFYEKDLSSPAAQQQLIEFHREGSSYHLVNTNLLNAQTASQGMPINRGNPIFQQHYNNQFSNGLTNSNGWPMNLRKISLVNGSLSGSKQTMTSNGEPFYTFANDNEKVLNLRGFQRVNISSPFGSITFRIHIASLEANFLPSSGSADTKIARFKKQFNDRTTKSPNYNPRGNMDNIPGGYFGAQKEIANPTQNTNPVPGTSPLANWSLNNLSITNFIHSISQMLGGSEWYLHEFNPIHSFIPSFSALGHLQPNQNWANPLNINLTCSTNRQTPFDSYFGLSKNTQHTSFTKESVDWLLKELAGQPQAPYFPVEPNTLVGLDKICLNTNSAYNFTNTCAVPSAVTTWSISSNLELISQSGYGIVVKGVESGEGTITAVFQNGQKLVKTIWVGSPTFSEVVYGTANTHLSLCMTPANNYTFSIPELNDSNKIKAVFGGLTPTEIDTNSNWEWTTSNNLIMLNGTKDSREICPMGSGQTSVSFRAKNACGWSEWFELPFEITELPLYGKQGPSIYTVYPNPSKDIVNIDLRDKDKQPEKAALISGELFDILGISRAKIEIQNNRATFSVNGLVKGIYILKIYIDGQVESHQIAVD